MSGKKILVSGVKPTGRPHIGNYFGAMKQFVDLQNEYDTRIFVANLHALTTIQNKSEMEELTNEVVLDYLGIGLDPEKMTLYLQSDVPHVTELTWVFNSLVTVPYLERAHAYKDAIANGREPNVGLFSYPVLMSADILVHDADVVPVGKDQKQHIEIARDIAQKFNNAFGETFKLPNELILESVATVPGTDGQKMSKSYNNTIPLFATDEEIESAVMSIVTDSNPSAEGGVPENVYEIHKLLKSPEELKELYENKQGQYKELKLALIKDLKDFITPLRERRKKWSERSEEVEKILREGGEKMRQVVHDKLVEVRSKVGLIHHG